MMANMGGMDDGAEFDEFDVTEDDFDQMMEIAEAALVTVLPHYARRYRAFEDYYTLSITPAGAVAASAGRWGLGPQWQPGVDSAIPSQV